MASVRTEGCGTLVTEDRVPTKDLSHLDTRLSPRLMPTGVTNIPFGVARVTGTLRMSSERGLFKRRAPQCGAPLILTFHASPVSSIVAAGLMNFCLRHGQIIQANYAPGAKQSAVRVMDAGRTAAVNQFHSRRQTGRSHGHHDHGT
jgi:hypothetical protein